jgi:hypothetical protein
MFVIISESCSECGSRAMKLVSQKPTQEEICEVERSVGRMYCITSEVIELELDGEIKIDEY